MFTGKNSAEKSVAPCEIDGVAPRWVVDQRLDAEYKYSTEFGTRSRRAIWGVCKPSKQNQNQGRAGYGIGSPGSKDVNLKSVL